MRRIDALGIGLALLAAGGLIFLGLCVAGLDGNSAGLWAQSLFFVGLMVWLFTYLARAVSGTMTYHQQRSEYEEAVLKKRFEALTPEELAALQAEIEAERATSNPTN
jgi:membrane protein implicated in regulation of membrane protease activity